MAGRIDETLPFHPLNIAVLTISDTRNGARPPATPWPSAIRATCEISPS